MIKEDSNKKSRIAVILEDIEKMRSLFEKYTFCFVSRVGNKCTHKLAKVAVKPVRNVSWEGNFPMWLHKSVQTDHSGSYLLVTDIVLSS